jgi:hypothetical protein
MIVFEVILKWNNKMLTEKNLLLDIIRNCPNESVWNISSDSWEKIPDLLPELRHSDIYGWDIIINQNSREQILRIIVVNELYEKIVHQDIKFQNVIIFQSFDNMSGSWIQLEFPKFDELISKYNSKRSICHLE